MNLSSSAVLRHTRKGVLIFFPVISHCSGGSFPFSEAIKTTLHNGGHSPQKWNLPLLAEPAADLRNSRHLRCNFHASSPRFYCFLGLIFRILTSLLRFFFLHSIGTRNRFPHFSWEVAYTTTKITTSATDWGQPLRSPVNPFRDTRFSMHTHGNSR